MSKDYYKVLGVDKNASAEDIKKAYRKMAHQHHPDKPGGSEEKFKEINEAFQVLGNQEKRQKFDQYGADFEQQGGVGGGVGWEDFMRAARGQNGGAAHFNFGGIDLGDLFGDLFGGGGRGGRSVQRGRDIQVDVEVNLEEVLHDQTKIMQLRKKNNCDVCNGSGAEPGTHKKSCGTCGGSGQIEHMQRTILGMMRTARTCETCYGAGQVPEKVCKHCRGDGVLTRDSDIKIKIPAGISDGETIRVSGHGESVQGGHHGDLYVRVSVRNKKGFERSGMDLYTDAHISFAQAALGDTISLETLDGSVKLAIPAGTQPGQRIRLKGYGVPQLQREGHRGDLYVQAVVEVPKKLNRKQKKLLEEFKELE